ncbi:MAG: hypothetical protein LBU76_04435 [Azoarcus sp.]|jgi:hypothetical protein|nr:hypothetical protein [Azoarcus sp.]
MKARVESVSYQSVAQEIANLEPLFAEKSWEDAAHRMSALVDRLGHLPPACPKDRAEIERTLANLAALVEHIYQRYGEKPPSASGAEAVLQ